MDSNLPEEPFGTPVAGADIYEVKALTSLVTPSKVWLLAIEPDEIRFHPTEAGAHLPEITITRAEAGDALKLMPGRIVGSQQTIGQRKSLVAFKLPEEAMEALYRWMAPMLDGYVKANLKKTLVFLGLIGIMFVVTGLPLKVLDRPVEWRPVPLACGAVLLLIAAAGRLWPVRQIVLVESLVCFALVGLNLFNIINGAWWAFFFCLLFLLIATGALFQYRLYNRMAVYAES